MIFSFGDSDPAPGKDISYHGASNRGSKGVVLISSSVNDQQEIPSDIQRIDFSFYGVIIPKADTIYYNEVHKIPDLPNEMHIIKVTLFFKYY